MLPILPYVYMKKHSNSFYFLIAIKTASAETTTNLKESKINVWFQSKH